MAASAHVPTLDRRTLNRTLLERQLLLRRRPLGVPVAIRHLVAIQAQEPRDPYVALWTRLETFDPMRLSSLLEGRRAVRMTLLRGTLHLVTAEDAVALRSVVQPAIDGLISGSSPMRTSWDDADRDALTSFLRGLLETEPRSRAELIPAIAERWPDLDADALAYALYLLPTVQVTPRGLWRTSGRSAFTTLDAWIGSPPSPDRDPAPLLRRYLRAFGPASVSDAQTWSRLPALREVFESERPRLRTFRDERGRELFDVPRAPIVDRETPAPVRFLPEYDNVLLSHQDRSRVVPDGAPVWGGRGGGTVLVFGFLGARWRVPNGTERVEVEPVRRLTRAERDEVAAEGRRLARFLLPEADDPDARILRG
jgi:hypothetical protein